MNLKVVFKAWLSASVNKLRAHMDTRCFLLHGKDSNSYTYNVCKDVNRHRLCVIEPILAESHIIALCLKLSGRFSKSFCTTSLNLPKYYVTLWLYILLTFC